MKIRNKISGKFLTIQGEWNLWTTEGTELTQTEVDKHLNYYNHNRRLEVVSSEVVESVEIEANESTEEAVDVAAIETVPTQPVNLQFFASSELTAKYNYIITKLEEARKSGNKRNITLWRNKLTKWQESYGAYQPIK